MNHWTIVKTPGEALSYMTEATLATVESLLERKNPPKHELARQVEIAQRGVTWLQQMQIDPEPAGRVRDVLKWGSVQEWVDAERPDLVKQPARSAAP